MAAPLIVILRLASAFSKLPEPFHVKKPHRDPELFCHFGRFSAGHQHRFGGFHVLICHFLSRTYAPTCPPPNISTIWTTLDFSQGGMATVLVVETKLALNPGDPSFRQADVHNLVQFVTAQAVAQNYHADNIRLVEVR